jgi:hypothetical protein
MKVKINKELLKDIKRIKEEEDRLLTSAEIKFSSNV